MGVAANEPNDRMKLFRSKEHKKFYNQMLKRGVMSPRTVDFDFLDSIEVNLREKLAFLQLENFCSETAIAYLELTTFFYSNLSFLDQNRIQFTVSNKDYVVDVDTLADIIGGGNECFSTNQCLSWSSNKIFYQ